MATPRKHEPAPSAAISPDTGGAAAAFEAAFRAHAAELCEFANGYVRSRELAAELVQDVFFRLWVRRDELHGIDDLRVYLFKATRNAALDALRHRRIEHRWQERSAGEPEVVPVGRLPDVADEVQRRELDAAIEAAVAQLPERSRQAFVLRWRHHLSNAEIAAIMGIAVKSVEIHRTRALKALRKALAHWVS